MRLALLGLGLIGGSIARAAHAAGWHVAAWTPSGTGPQIARAQGSIDVAAPALRDALEGVDLVVLAAPPGACFELLGALAGPDGASLRPATVISDVASTKVLLAERAASLGLRYVGGHPMAGRETSGFAAGSIDLLRDRPWVVVPPPKGDEAGVALVEQLVLVCGARPLRMTAIDHDAAVAAISHLPLVVAAALVEAVAGVPGGPVPAGWPAASALAASGWAGATRLARGDPAMGAGIAVTNARPLAAAVRAMRDRLDDWLVLLDPGPGEEPAAEEALRERFAAARARLEDGR